MNVLKELNRIGNMSIKSKVVVVVLKYFFINFFVIGGLTLSNIFMFLVLSNSTRTGENVMLEGDSRCFTYLQWKNGHILQERETGMIETVYIKPIIAVVSCKGEGL